MRRWLPLLVGLALWLGAGPAPASEGPALVGEGPARSGEGPATGPSLVRRQRAGRALLGVGVGAQMVNLGFTVSGLFTDNATPGVLSNAVTAGFAPVAATGFRFALSDGSLESERRATAIGLFQGAGYAALIAGLHAIWLPVHASRCVPYTDDLGQTIYPCFEDVSGLFVGVAIGINSAVAVSLLIAGLAVRLSPITARAQVQVMPWGTSGGGGLSLAGRF